MKKNPLQGKVFRCFMAFVLCFQMFFTSGVTSAIAEGLDGNTTVEQQQQQLNTVSEDSSGSSGKGEQQSAGTDGEGSDAASAGDQSNSASASSQQSSTSASSAAQSGSTASENANTSEQSSQQAEAKDWTELKDNLKLSTDGLDFADSLAAQAKKIAAATAEGTTDAATVGAASQDVASVTLPNKLDAKLNIKATLNVAAGNGRDASAAGTAADSANTIVEGDNFKVTLPNGIAANTESSNVVTAENELRANVYSIDAETGKASTNVIGYAVVSEGSITVKLNAPKTAASSVDAVIDLDVLVSSYLVKDEESTLNWTIQKNADDAKLTIPAKRDVASALGLVGEAAAIQTAAEESTGSQIGDQKKVQSGKTSALQFVTHWADNNAEVRPSAATLQAGNEYRLYYSLDGGTTKKTLTTDGVNLTDEAKADLGIESLTPSTGTLLSITQSATNDYTVSSTNELPLTITTKELKRIDVDEETGKETEVWEDVDTKTVTYYIKHDYDSTTSTAIAESSKIYPGTDGKAQYIVSPKSSLKTADQEAGKYINEYQEEVLSLLATQKFTVKYSFGEGIDDTFSFMDFFMQKPDYQTFTVHIGDFYYNLNGDYFTRFYKDGYFTGSWSDSAPHSTGAIEVTAPAFYPDGTPMEYSYTQQAEDQDPDPDYVDYFQIRYDNSAGTNHGSDVSAVYEGGTIYLTHSGTTKYTATKKWADDDASARPATTYTLWRFVDNGNGDYGTASMVKTADNSAFIEFTISAEENQAAGSDGIDLGAKLQEQLAATGTTLAKYDSAGYSYVYMLREDAPSGYERLYGTTINTDESSADYGKIVKGSDTKPNYYGPDTTKGTTDASVAKDVRPSDDRSIYNGGTIINRRTDTETVEAQKSWVVGTFQDQLTNVTSVFQLQRIAKVHATQNADGTYSPNGTIDESTGKAYDWVDVAGGTKEITGWTAETLTQEFEGSGAKYDALGEEYVYRYIETDVLQGGTSVVTAKGDDGVTAFHLSLTDNDGSTQDVSFNVSRTRDAQTGETKIQNTYVDVTDAHVHKYWAETYIDDEGNEVAKKDDSGNTIYTQDEKPNGKSRSVTFKIIRTGVDGNTTYGPYTLDGTPDAQPTKIDGLDGATVQETTSWNLDFQNLPRYDENGSKYTYMCFESSSTGWVSSTSYSPKSGDESNVTTVYNSPAPSSEWSRVSVTKKWVDGGNTSARVPVKVGIYAGKELYNQKYKDWVDAGSEGDMPSGAVHYNKGDLIRTVTLTESNGWYYEGGIGISGVSQQNGDVYIREISNGLTGEQQSTVITKDEAQTKYDSDPTTYAVYSDLLRNWGDNANNQFNERMLTGTSGESEAYCYQVSYGFNSTLNSMQVENRRLGQTWIRVNKAWNDQGHDTDTRPTCQFKISCTTSAVTFIAGDDGYIYAQVNGGNKLMLYKEYVAGKADTPMTTSDATVSEDGRYLIFQIDTTDEHDTVLVGSLPKYDGQGFVFSYNVEEEITQTGTDYYSAQTNLVEKYNSTYHFTDSMQVEFTNGRSGTKDVVFNTRWYDAYVSSTLNQRPDLYLTLYKTVYQYDDSGNLVYNSDGTPACTYEVVSDYEDYRWSSLVGSESGHDNERATIKNLQKYDSHGKEIVYYATCQSHAQQSALDDLDYQKLWFTTTAEGVSGKQMGNTVWDEHNASDAEVKIAASEGAVSGTMTALREDGTFNYEIASSINISGQKIWGNFPGIYTRADLPNISVYVQRRVAGSNTTWQNPTFTAADNAQGYTIDGMTGATGTDAADGKTVIAGTHNLTYASYGKFNFNMKYYGINTTNSDGTISGETEDAVELPKYDANGNLYEYRTIEVIDGLLSTDKNPVPGGFTIDDLNNSTDIASGNPDKVFTTKSGDGSSYTINNNYGPSTGKLTVKKVFDGYTAGDKFANLTYTLYRYYIKADGTHSVTQSIGTKTLGASQIGEDGTGQVDFENVDIYDPNGQYWVYYVEEASVDGYSTQVMLGNASGADDSAFADATKTTSGYASPDTYEKADSGVYSKSTRVADDSTPDFTFKNTYVPESIGVNGTKIWNDNENVANIRPGDISITVKRTYSDGSADQSLVDGKLELQTTDSTAANYLRWAKSDTGNWTYTISNVEKWATNGAAWRYTVTEESSSVDGTEYVISSTGGTLTASDGASFPNIVNDLKTRVEPKKVWAEDDSDWLAQRPTFYYELQARFTSGDRSTDWEEVGDAFKNVTGACHWDETTIAVSDTKTLTGHMLKNKNGELSSVGSVSPDGKGKSEWTGTAWDNLPTSAKVGDDVKSVEYRVVEKCLVYNQSAATPTVVEFADPDASGAYTETYSPYNPSISSSKSTDDAGQVTVTSTMANTLDTTSVSVTKTWADDDDNKWASRPGTTTASDAWTLQFAIQRSTDGTNWEWVTTRGAAVTDSTALNTDGTFNTNLRTVELSSADTSASKTFENLPKADTDGNAYTYRLAERLTGSYGVSGSNTVIATALDGKVKLVTVLVDTTSGSSAVAFNNSLKTVGLEGTKNWNDYGAGLVPSFDNPPTMVLQQRIGSGDWTEVKYADGTKPQITWAKTSDDRVWTYSYSGLPSTDKSGNTIEYRAIEDMSASNGFVESYAGGAAGSTFDSDRQMFVNSTITNTATRFTLKKIGDNTTGSASEELNGVTLKVRNADNTKTYAVWTRDDDGTVKSYVNVNGVTEDASSTDLSQFTEMTGSNAGYIIALAAGTYTITETRTPEGHLQAADATVTISATGAISAADATIESDNLTLDITDPVFRGNVDLYKYYRHAGDGGNSMPGMTFDLYQGTPDGTNVKIAEGITLQKYTKDYIGKWYGWATGSLSKSGMAVNYLTDDAGNSLLGKYYVTTADGLPLGNYFFKETGTSPYTVKAETTYAFEITANSDATKQPAYVFQRAENTEFNVEAYVAKANSEDGSAVNNATFKLEYIPEGSTSAEWTTIGSEFVTGSTYEIGANMSGSTKVDGAAGELRFKYLKKGQYRLTELSDSGYEVGTGSDATVATWTISDADQNKTVDLADGSNLAVPGVVWTNAAFKNGKLSNTPKHGAVKMTKVSSASATTINGTTMKLQKKSGDTWADVATGLVTGKNYVATIDESGAVTAVAEDASTTAADGTITVSNLSWGTYKFVETQQTDGYVGKTGTGQTWAESSELAISRDNVEASQTTPVAGENVKNQPTNLKIVKASADGSKYLGGAKFTVTGKFVSGQATKNLTTEVNTGEAKPVSSDDELQGELIVGETYTIKEVTPPEGYTYDETTSEFKVTMTDTGLVTSASGEVSGWALASDASSYTSTLTRSNTPTKVIVFKNDENGDALAGSEFTITGKMSDGSTSATIVPKGENTSSVVEKLIVGETYTVSETKVPAGYTKIANVQVKVNNDGSLQFVGDVPDGWEMHDSGWALTASDTPAEFSLKKTDDSADAKTLANGTFSVQGLFVDADGNVSETTKDFTTTSSATTLSVQGILVQGTAYEEGGAAKAASGDYVVSEKTSPLGYAASMKTFTIHVNADGSVTGTSDSPYAFDASSKLITLADTPISFSFNKKNASGSSLDGAEFTITGKFADMNGSVGETQTLTKQSVSDLSALKFAQGQEYELTETASPAGYELISGTVKFALDQSGKASITSAVDGYSVDASGMSITATDTATSLKIKKAATDGTALAGAKFTLEPATGSAFADGSTTAIELTTGTDGTVDVADAKLVVNNSYYLTETDAPAGYKKINGRYKIDVATDGTVTGTAVDVENGTFSVADNKVEVDVADEAVPFSLTKYSSESYSEGTAKALAGAKFKVTPIGDATFADSSTKAIEFATGEDGQGGSAELAGKLVVGSVYSLQEVAAPAGYKLVDGSMAFTVNKDGSLSATGECPAAYHMSGTGEITVFTGDVTDDPTRIAVRKVSAESTALGLGGATFELAPAQGSTFADGSTAAVTATTQGEKGSSSDTSATTGLAEFDKAMLVADGKTTYQLRETVAPWGYKLNSYVASFTVATDGTVSFADSAAAAAAGYSVTESGMFTVTAKDTPIDVTLKKTDLEGAASLANTQFTVAPAEGINDDGEANHFADGSTASISKITGEDGQASLHNVLVYGNSYTVTEVQPTEGYGTIADGLTFKVLSDGTIQKVSGPDAYVVDGADATITGQDPAIDLSFAKSASSETTASMAGAEFTITPVGESAFAGGSTEPIVMTIGEGGVSDVCSKQLLAGGSYSIAETKAPAGFKPLAQGITVNVSMTGEIMLSDESKAVEGWSLAKSGTAYVVSAVDDTTSFKIVKESSADSSKKLSGAQFSVSGKFTSGTAIKNLVTDADGVAQPATAADSLTDELIVGETYTVKEVTPPAGYTYDEPTAEFKVTMTESGYVTSASGAVTGWSLVDDTEAGTSVLTRSNAPTKAVVYKADENGSVLTGSEFTITGKMADGSESCTIAPAGEATPAVTEKLIAGETYTITESKVPAGYTKIGDVQVKMNNDGTLSFVGDVPAGWTLRSSGWELVAQDAPAEFSLKKTDDSADAKTLANGTFSVQGLFVDADGNVSETTKEFTTTSSAAALSVQGILVQGTAYEEGGAAKAASGDYVVSEKTSPLGYAATGKTLAVHVSADGTVTATPEAGSPYTFDPSSKLVTLANAPISLSFAKKGYSVESLEGAEFTITGRFADTDGNVGEAQTLAKQSIAQLSTLKFAQGQEYELAETKAPAGYELIPGTVKFTLDQTGKATIADAVEGYEVDASGASITATDAEIGIQLKKTNAEGAPLANAVFSLEPAAGSAFADGSTAALTLTTKADGTVDGLDAVLVAGNAYCLSETTAPAGYKQIEGQLKIAVADDGTIAGTPIDVRNGTFSVADNKVEVDVADEAVPFSLTKYSSESYSEGTAKALAGAKFKVTPIGDATFADGSTKAIEFATGEDGQGGSAELAGKLVVGKVYSLQEVAAPAGYKLVDGSMAFTVNKDGSLSATGECPAAYHMSGTGEITVFTGDVTDDPTRIAVRKVSAESTALGLGGATFELVPAQGSTFADGSTAAVTATTQGAKGSSSDTSATTGLAEFDKAMLVADGKTTYQIRETVAPWGYELNSYVASFTVATDGSISFTDSKAASAAGYSVTESGMFTVTAKDAPIDVTLKKTDSYGMLMLANTKYVVAPAEGTNDDGEANHFADASKSSIEATTDSNGQATLRGQLVYGNSYTVTEVQPTEGYGAIADGLTLKVLSDGTIQKVSGPDAYVVDGANATITGQDPAIDLSFAKSASSETTASMAGAEFTITPVGESTFAGGSTEPIVMTIGEGGASDVCSKQLLAGGSYSIAETKAPAGFKPLAQSITVNVSMTGEILLSDESKAVEGWSLAKSGTAYVVSAVDDTTSFKIVKESSADSSKKLSGAQFSVSGKFTSGTAIKNLVTDADGVAQPATAADSLTDELIVGETYTVKEVTPPAGYTYDEPTAEFKVTMTESGYVTSASGAVTGWSLVDDTEAGTSVLTRSNAPTKAVVYKADENGSVLTGSEFTITGKMADGSESCTIAPEGEATPAVTEKLIAGETYAITESKVPAGYTKIGDVQVKMNNDGTLSFVGDVPAGWTLRSSGWELVAQDAPAEFSLKKTDDSADAKTLANGTFSVQGLFVDADGNVSETTKDFTTTSSAATLSVQGILVQGTAYEEGGAAKTASGDYIVSEKTSPLGYVATGKTLAVHVSADGTVTATPEAGSPYTFDPSSKLVTLANTPISLSFAKKGYSVESLEGAEFTITGRFADTDGNVGETQTLAKQSIAQLSALKFAQGQEYSLTETKAPAGYELIEGTVKFTLDQTGKATIDDAVEGYEVDASGASITATDAEIGIQLKKTNAEGAPLANAVFSLEPAAGSAFADGSTAALTLTTKADGTVDGLDAVLVAGNAYCLSETTAPAGYKQIEGQLKIAVADDGTIAGTPIDVRNGTFSVADNKVEVDVADEAVPFSLTKYSSEDYAEGTAKALSGAVFTVAPASGSAFADGSTAAIEFATGSDGKGGSAELAGKLVVGSSYTLQEKTAPAGYKLVDGSMAFTVNEDGSLSATGECPAAYHMSGTGEITVFTGDVTDDPTRIAVRKVSAESTALGLGGATFELAPAQGSTFADGSTAAVTATTQGDKGSSSDASATTGLAEFDKAMLVADGKTTYQLRETVAPWGYELNAYVASFTVATDGTVSFADSAAAAAAGYSVTESGMFTVTAKDAPIDVTLRKTDSYGMLMLANTKYVVAPAEGANDDGEANHFADASKASIEATTDANGQATLHVQLVYGNSYTVTEVQPTEGYGTIADGLTFKVLSDGTIQKVSGPDAYAVDGANATITGQDAPIQIQFFKSSTDDKAAIAMTGAEFTITPVGESAFAGGSTEPIAMTVGENALSEVLSAQLLAGGSYTISETKAPAGYKPVQEDITINVSATGVVELSEESQGVEDWGITPENGIYIINAIDVPTGVGLLKYSADDEGKGEALVGGEYELTGNFAVGDGSYVHKTAKVKTLANGELEVDGVQTANIEGLTVGETYVLAETKAPAGYELDSAALHFAVKEDGKVKVAEGYELPENYGIIESTDGYISVITQSDEPVELYLSKKGLANAGSKDDPILAGAVFKITAYFGSEDGSAMGEVLYVKTLENGKLQVSLDPNFSEASEVDYLYGFISTEGELDYLIEEIAAPDGYELNAGEVKFGINDDGTVVCATADGCYASEGETITVRDEAIQASLFKTDAEGNALKGAEFEVRAQNGGKFVDGTDVKTIVSGEDGSIAFEGLVQGTSYTLKETKAPEGYATLEDEATFTVGTDGKLSFVGNVSDKFSLNAEQDKVSVVNTKQPVEEAPSILDNLAKTGDTTPLAAALFALISAVAAAAYAARRRKGQVNA